MNPTNLFEAVKLYPEGWVVLSPWITLPSGQQTRLHYVPGTGASFSIEAERYCRHIAAELNRVRENEK